jgi:hypothetical protein
MQSHSAIAWAISPQVNRIEQVHRIEVAVSPSLPTKDRAP